MSQGGMTLALGRWAQPDSIVPLASQGVQAWDRYAYVNNNPIKNNDPSGHCIGPLSFLLPYCVLGAIAIVGEYSKLMAEVDNLPPYEPEPTPLRPPASSTPSPLLTPSQTPSAPMVTNTQDAISIVDIVDFGENFGDTIFGADLSNAPAFSEYLYLAPQTKPFAPGMEVAEAAWGTKQQLGIDFSENFEMMLSATPPPTPTIGPSVTPSATPTSRPTYTPEPPTHTPTPYLLTPTATPY